MCWDLVTLVMMRRTRMIVGTDADPLEPGDIHDDKDCVLFVSDPRGPGNHEG